MFIELNLSHDLPLYEQIKNQIIIAIAKNELKEGDRLPSVRSLASDIGINLHTVNKAYKQLEEAGFLSLQRQRGAIIQKSDQLTADLSYRKQLTAQLRPIIADAVCRDLAKEELLELIEEMYKDFEVTTNE